MDLHVVWGWLDSVLNGCKRCFLLRYCTFNCTAVLYCEVILHVAFTENVEADWRFSFSHISFRQM